MGSGAAGLAARVDDHDPARGGFRAFCALGLALEHGAPLLQREVEFPRAVLPDARAARDRFAGGVLERDDHDLPGGGAGDRRGAFPGLSGLFVEIVTDGCGGGGAGVVVGVGVGVGVGDTDGDAMAANSLRVSGLKAICMES